MDFKSAKWTYYVDFSSIVTAYMKDLLKTIKIFKYFEFLYTRKHNPEDGYKVTETCILRFLDF